MKKKFFLSVILTMLVFQGCKFNNDDSQMQATISTERTETPQQTEHSEHTEITKTSNISNTSSENKTTLVADDIGITAENYPRIDGSTSTLPLVQSIYRNMFYSESGEFPNFPEQASKTMQSYELLIAGDVDLILVPDPSNEVEEKVNELGVELEYIPIGAEAFVFITHEDNPALNITKEQAQKIYSSMTITNWSEIGGVDGRIVPICRNSDAGSQAQMENLILEGKPIAPEIEENFLENDMNGMLQMVEEYKSFANENEENAYAIGYTMYYYLNIAESVMGEVYVKPLAFEGVEPTPETIRNKEFPLAINYYAVMRKDTPKNHSARKITDWLISYDGQWHVGISGLGVLKPLYEAAENE